MIMQAYLSAWLCLQAVHESSGSTHLMAALQCSQMHAGCARTSMQAHLLTCLHSQAVHGCMARLQSLAAPSMRPQVLQDLPPCQWQLGLCQCRRKAST